MAIKVIASRFFTRRVRISADEPDEGGVVEPGEQVSEPDDGGHHRHHRHHPWLPEAQCGVRAGRQ